ncbi:MAG: BBP7 family outer membrane beta-barrel protein [Thermoguttaceae bacterium]
MLFSRILTLAMIAVTCAVAPLGVRAQSGRFFTPFTDAGSQQQSQGLYGSLEAIYWNFSAPKDTPIGYTDANGNSGPRDVFLGGRSFTQHNSLSTAALGEANASFGVRFEVGNVRDHQGWLFSGYGLPGQNSTTSVTGTTSMVIKDNGHWDDASVWWTGDGTIYTGGGQVSSTTWIWDPSRQLATIGGLDAQRWGAFSGTTWFVNDGTYDGQHGISPAVGLGNLGPGNQNSVGPGGQVYPDGPAYFHGLGPFDMSGRVVDVTDGAVRPGLLWGYVPLAIEEQGYLYPIPGATARPWYAEGNRTITYYGVAPLPIVFSNVTVNSKTDNWSGEAMYTYRLHPTRWCNVEFLGGIRYWQLNDDFSVAASGEYTHRIAGGNGTAAGDFRMSTINATSINSSAYNRIIGPQIGARLQRSNERWAGIAEMRFFAGFNNIELKNSGLFATGITSGTGSQYGEALGLIGKSASFQYRKTRNEFSPGFEFRLNGSWRLTRQLSLQGGFTSVLMGNVIRGAAVNDYSIQSDNRFFGIRSDKHALSSVVTYGFNVGLVLNRF